MSGKMSEYLLRRNTRRALTPPHACTAGRSGLAGGAACARRCSWACCPRGGRSPRGRRTGRARSGITCHDYRPSGGYARPFRLVCKGTVCRTGRAFKTGFRVRSRIKSGMTLRVSFRVRLKGKGAGFWGGGQVAGLGGLWLRLITSVSRTSMEVRRIAQGGRRS
jgi:hypothetical protein